MATMTPPNGWRDGPKLTIAQRRVLSELATGKRLVLTGNQVPYIGERRISYGLWYTLLQDFGFIEFKCHAVRSKSWKIKPKGARYLVHRSRITPCDEYALTEAGRQAVVA